MFHGVLSSEPLIIRHSPPPQPPPPPPDLGAGARYNPIMPNIDRHAPGTFTWIELATSDQDAANTFYADLFGYEAIQQPLGNDQMYTIFRIEGRDAGACYTIQEDEKKQGVPPHWNLYIAVASADESAKKAG